MISVFRPRSIPPLLLLLVVAAQAPAIMNMGVKVGKIVKLPGNREVEMAGNIFNVFNDGSFTQYTYNSAYQSWSPNFLQMRNRQPARSFQLTAVLRF